jgi:hypothetical protein
MDSKTTRIPTMRALDLFRTTAQGTEWVATFSDIDLANEELRQLVLEGPGEYFLSRPGIRREVRTESRKASATSQFARRIICTFFSPSRPRQFWSKTFSRSLNSSTVPANLPISLDHSNPLMIRIGCSN